VDTPPATGKDASMSVQRLADAVGLLGRSATDALAATGAIAHLGLLAVVAALRRPQRRPVIMGQCFAIGFRSLPVVMLTGLAIGLVLAFQIHTTLVVFRGETMVGAMVNYGIFTQLAPVITGLMISGRVGSSIAAELGTMQVTEQIDALRTMGTDPVDHLVAPRLVACVLLMPFLTAVSALMGVYGAYVLATSTLGIDAPAYWERAVDFNTPWEVLTGLAKTLIFGALIALVACFEGLRTRGGATGVGESCTRAVVTGSILVLIANFLLTVLLQRARDAFMT
jgi:phospholipid/cholesterol/gamma-HCH transport system permease protein